MRGWWPQTVPYACRAGGLRVQGWWPQPVSYASSTAEVDHLGLCAHSGALLVLGGVCFLIYDEAGQPWLQTWLLWLQTRHNWSCASCIMQPQRQQAGRHFWGLSFAEDFMRQLNEQGLAEQQEQRLAEHEKHKMLVACEGPSVRSPKGVGRLGG